MPERCDDRRVSGIDIDVVRVFTDDRGRSGNPLGLVTAEAARGREQELAAALGFSETVVVGEVAAGVATIRIFTPTREMPFAGHPTVGTAWWLASTGRPVRTLRVPAGDVDARAGDGDAPTWITADPAWAPTFEWHDVASGAEVDALDPAAYEAGHHYVWAWTDEATGRIRSRMFAPDMGIVEDQATGAAAIALTGRLERDLDIVQGRGCRLATRWREGVVDLGGRVVADPPRRIELPAR